MFHVVIEAVSEHSNSLLAQLLHVTRAHGHGEAWTQDQSYQTKGEVAGSHGGCWTRSKGKDSAGGGPGDYTEGQKRNVVGGRGVAPADGSYK